jgi:hypothetical protein
MCLSVQAAAEEAAAHVTHVNLLLNASGVLHIPGVMSPGTLPPAHVTHVMLIALFPWRHLMCVYSPQVLRQ